jgi:hypothetical protein
LLYLFGYLSFLRVISVIEVFRVTRMLYVIIKVFEVIHVTSILYVIKVSEVIVFIAIRDVTSSLREISWSPENIRALKVIGVVRVFRVE